MLKELRQGAILRLFHTVIRICLVYLFMHEMRSQSECMRLRVAEPGCSFLLLQLKDH